MPFLPSPGQRVPGHHDTTGAGCFVPAEPRTAAAAAGLAEVPPASQPTSWGAARGAFSERGSGLAPLLMLGLRLLLPPSESCRVPGATLLCAEDKQRDACGPECALRPMAMRPTGREPTGQMPAGLRPNQWWPEAPKPPRWLPGSLVT